MNPNDSILLERFGRVYVKAHYYQKAVDFYTQVLSRKDNNIDLKLDLVEVYIKLQRLRDAEAILIEDDSRDRM